VIVRFCGTSPGSVSGHKLIVSICHQIHYLYELPYNTGNIEALGYDDAVKYFQGLLNQYAVILFIDSLDQLTNENLARSHLTFLKGLKPHKDTRVIVSCLPDERDETDPTGTKWKYIYGCSTKLQAAKVPSIEVSLLSDSAGSREIVAALLESAGRTLTGPQWARVMECVAVEPTALYINLAVSVVQHWPSQYVCDGGGSNDDGLTGGVAALINQIVDDKERQFGRAFVRAALAFITFSVAGVTDTEMCDLLSLDDKVLSKDQGINKYNDSNRVPIHVWLRLQSEIAHLIVERSGGCRQWYHRQLTEVVAARYSDPAELGRFRRIMATYFGNIVDPGILEAREISRQPLTLNCVEDEVWYPEALVNGRRCVEAGAHMLAASMWDEAEAELCTLESVCARAKAGTCLQMYTCTYVY